MKKINDEFKWNVVKLVREEGLKIEEVASDLSIDVSTLKVWLSKHDHSRLIKTEKQAREEEEKLTEEVEQIFYEHKKRYGSPIIFMELKEKGVHCSEKRVANIMKKNNLVAKQRKKKKEVSSKREEAELA